MSEKTPQEPIASGFGAQTTAQEIVNASLGDGDLAGKVAVVTGGYSGIGLEVTRALAGAGASVLAPARSVDKAADALSALDGAICAAPMDLGDLASVRSFAADVLDAHSRLDLLINNAGVMAAPLKRLGPGSDDPSSEFAGWESQLAINHFGHFALAEALTPALLRAAEKGNDRVRIVALSSTAHKRSAFRFDDPHFLKEPYDKWIAYGQSKTANSLFAVEADRRYADDGVRAFAVHPGGIRTPLQRHLEIAEMVELGWLDETGEIAEAAKPFFKTPEQGAATTLWCALSPQLDGHGGVYCEDCDIASFPKPDSLPFFHVAPHAVDGEAASRLWDWTVETMSGAR